MALIDRKTLFKLFLLLLISGSAFTVYVLSSVFCGWLLADAALVYDLELLPKRLLLSQYLSGVIQSLLVTLPLGVLAVLDFTVLARFRATRMLAGLSLPVVILLAGYWWYHGERNAMLALALSAALMWLLYRFALLFAPGRTA